MSNLFKTFKADENLEKSGVVLQYGTNSKNQPIEFRIARAGGSNVRYTKVLEHKAKPYRRMMQQDSLDRKISDRIMREVYAETVILSWSGVEDENDNDIPFNQENVIKVLTDLPDLFTDIQEQANKLALFRAADLSEDAKN